MTEREHRKAEHSEREHRKAGMANLHVTRPSSLEAFCKGLEGATQRFIIKLAYKWGLWRN